jgi:hypothetical protein
MMFDFFQSSKPNEGERVAKVMKEFVLNMHNAGDNILRTRGGDFMVSACKYDGDKFQFLAFHRTGKIFSSYTFEGLVDEIREYI